MKKVVSLLLALVMVFAMAVPAFAADSIVIEDDVSPKYGNVAKDFLYKIDAEKIINKYDTDTIMYGNVDTYECNGPVTLTVESDVVNGCGMGFSASYATDMAVFRYGSYNFSVVEGFEKVGNDYKVTLDKPGVYLFSGMVGGAPFRANLLIVINESKAPEVTYELKSFSDVAEKRWSHSAIMEMVDLGLFKGATNPDKNGIAKFNPEGQMKVSEFITVIERMLWQDELNEYMENNDQGAYWYSRNYNFAVDMGLITKEEFRINDMDRPITREEMSLLATRALHGRGEFVGSTAGVADLIPDYSKINYNYTSSVEIVYMMGIITGMDDMGTFAPKNTLTREQGAMVAYRILHEEARKMPVI